MPNPDGNQRIKINFLYLLGSFGFPGWLRTIFWTAGILLVNAVVFVAARKFIILDNPAPAPQPLRLEHEV